MEHQYLPLNKSEKDKYNYNKISFLFFIVGTLLYINTVKNDFSLDDYLVTQAHPYVTKGLKGIPDILTSPYMTEDKIKGEFRPVAQISFAIEYELFENNPHANHFFNTIIYGIICMLVFRLFTRIFSENYYQYIFLGTLIFVLHPIHTEVVANIKNRENLLSTLFGLLACLQAVKYIDKRAIKHFILSVIFLLFSVFSKVDGIIFGFFIYLISYFKQMKSTYIFIYVFFIISVFLSYVFYKSIIIPDAFRNSELHETPLIGENKNFINTLKLSLITWWYYLKLNIFPYPLRFYYGTGLINIPSWNNPVVWLSAILNGGLLFFGIKGLKKRTFYSFSILWYLGGIFLFSQLVEPVIGIVAERHSFIASIGFSMLLGGIIIKVFHYLKKLNKLYVTLFTVFVGAIFLSSVIYVINRNKNWYNATTLYDADMKHLEESIFPHFERGNQYARETGIDPSDTIKYKKNLDLSIVEYKKVLRSMPGHASSWYNMGISYLRNGMLDSANHSFMATYRLDSTYRSVNHLIGLTELYTKDTATAIIFLKKELDLKPNNGSTIELLYSIYTNKKDYKPFLDICNSVEKRGVRSKILFKAMANAYYFYGDYENAIRYRKTIENYMYEDNNNSEW
ncbi:MAG: hypothetical protein BGO87_09745 [Flavobacteriia bacterium 40-80]|nr:MAG: hypothetical protein BGO87_09745 [Flavobacteriia bacterium 40-80]